MTSKHVLITGAAGGLGQAVVKLLIQKGFVVYGADIHSEPLLGLRSQDAFVPLDLDVTQSASVGRAVETLKQHTDGLDAVVHLAGVLALGSLIEMEESTLRGLLEVNVLGTFRVNQAFFPLLQKRRGRILNISSETGWQSGAPFNGAYAMSKHAIECYSDSLRRELQLLGVRVVKIRPGAFDTQMVRSVEPGFEKMAEQTRWFQLFMPRVQALAKSQSSKAHSPELLARLVCKVLITKRPKHAYSLKPNWGRSFLELLPVPVADWLFRIAISKKSATSSLNDDQ